jgi:BlaI family penicillinase repressor
MIKKFDHDLSRRERQIMQVIYRRSAASVSDVLCQIPSPPSYSAVRSIMNILVEKGLLKRTRNGKKYLYSPRVSRKKAMQSALKQLMSTYLDDSLENAVTALLDIHGDDLGDEDFQRLMGIIEKARKERGE